MTIRGCAFLIILAGGALAQVEARESPDLRPIRYPSGEVSLNDRCPVRNTPLNPFIAPVYVNGQPIGFC